MKINYLEESFNYPSYFINEMVFDATYIPEEFNHRENELILLSRFFLPILKNPYDMSKKIVIVGKIGIGKTITVHKFGKMLQESAEIRKINLKFLHLNCRTVKSDYLILKTILDSLIGDIPARGLSIGELNKILIDHINQNPIHLILVFDEMDYLLNRNSDLIYGLTRLNETGKSYNFGLSIIGIVKKKLDLNHLDRASMSSLQNNVIIFKKYTVDQIFYILKQRTKLGLVSGIISDEMIKMIADLSVSTGDMRYSINLLKNAVVYCENNRIKSVIPEAIRIANSEYSTLSTDELKVLNLHELILLKATCNVLKVQKSREVSLNYIKEEYMNLCKQYGKIPRANTQIWEYIQNLKKSDFFTASIRNKNIKGRKTFVGILKYSINKILREVDSVIKDWVMI